MPDPKPSSPREAYIAAKVDAEKTAFQAFRAQHSQELSQRHHIPFPSIPREVVSHLFLPEKLLQQAQKPENVEVIILDQTDDTLHAVVVEHTGQILTNLESLRNHSTAIQDARKNNKDIPPLPDDVDPEHRDYPDMLEGYDENAPGPVKLSDRIMLRVCLALDSTDQLTVVTYQDVKEIRGKGIATEFYLEHLYPFARTIGMRFVTGSNDSDNREFFLQKIGRYRLSDIKSEYQDNFEFDEDDSNSSTIYFLYPEDADNMVKKSSRRARN